MMAKTIFNVVIQLILSTKNETCNFLSTLLLHILKNVKHDTQKATSFEHLLQHGRNTSK